MKRIISLLLIAVLMLGSFSFCFGADDQVRYSYHTRNYTHYDTVNTVSGVRAKLTIPNYVGTLNVELTTSEGKGPADVLVVYVPNDMWDGESYYSAVSGVISGAYKVYDYSDQLVKWNDLYNYGFLPVSGGIYTDDYNSLQMHFLNGPGLYTALATIYYSKTDLGLDTVEQMKAKAPSSLEITAAGHPFILVLDDTTIDYFLEYGRMISYGGFDWPGLEDLLLEARYELPSTEAEQALKNFTNRNNYYRGIFLDVGLGASMWYDESVQTVYALGLMQGDGAYFNPGGNITLAQAIAMASRLHNIYNGGTGRFSEGPVWYSVYINYAVKNNIIKSFDFSAGVYGSSVYSRYATRAEMAYIFSNAMPRSAMPKINKISEVPDVARYSTYGQYIYRLYDAGILDGDNRHNFNPNKYITRAEAAAIISRMARPALRLEFTL